MLTMTPSMSMMPPRIAEDEAEGALDIDVADTGKGIQDEALANIFEPFRQEENKDSRGFQGIGLGLSVAIGAATPRHERRACCHATAHQISGRRRVGGGGRTFGVFSAVRHDALERLGCLRVVALSKMCASGA